MTPEELAVEKLQHLTKRKYILFTDRGNTSIQLSLKLGSHLKIKNACIQDQGGWLTYDQFIKREKLNLLYIDTDYGFIKQEELAQFEKNSLLLLNTMPGYFALEESIPAIETICKENSVFLINDVSGSIGTNAAKYGDVIIGSFGRWKPVNVEYGGFIAVNNKEHYDFLKKALDKQIKPFYEQLNEKLDQLPDRLKLLRDAAEIVKKDLNTFEIVHKNAFGFNVVVKFSSIEEKMEIIDYCNLNGYEFTLCPRYIRVMEDAVSIEIKRLI